MTRQIQFPVVFLGHRVSPPTTQRQLETKKGKKSNAAEREKNNFPPGAAPTAVCDRVAVCVSCCFLNYECTWGSESALIIIRRAGKKTHRDEDFTPGARVHIQTIAVLAQRLQQEFPSV